MLHQTLRYLALLFLPLAANAQETRDLVIDDSIRIDNQTSLTQELIPILRFLPLAHMELARGCECIARIVGILNIRKRTHMERSRFL